MMHMNVMGRQRGVTFFEVLIVMGIFALVSSFALLVSMQSYRSANFRSDRNLLVAALQRARAQSMNNVCLGTVCTDGKAHGVAIQPIDHLDSFVVFQTSSGGGYTGRASSDIAHDAIFPVNPNSVITQTTIVFTQLSGTAPASVIEIDQAGYDSDVHVETNGRIWWTI